MVDKAAADLTALELGLACSCLPLEIVSKIVGHLVCNGVVGDLVNMLAVCQVWRQAVWSTEAAWQRLFMARFPTHSQSKRLRRLSHRDLFLVQTEVEKLRLARASAPRQCTDKTFGLEDFTFTIEVKVCELREDDWSMYANERERYPVGSFESWVGVLTQFHEQSFNEDCGPLMGSLQGEFAEVEVSAYVTTPTLCTSKLYDRGRRDGFEDRFEEHKLPYAHEASTDGFSEDFIVGVHTSKSSVGIYVRRSVNNPNGFSEYLTSNEMLAYLRGEEILCFQKRVSPD
jgi:hypothetical protein